MIFSIKPQIFELKCVFSYFRLKTHITLLLPVYVHSWEQRKLGEVSESYSGGTPSVGNKSYYGGSIPFIRSAEINSESTELFLTEEGLTNSSARMVSKGDILYALYGATSGETGRSRINGAINQAILAILPHDGYDSEFLMQWLRKSKQNITDIYLQGGQGNLSGAIVKALEVNFPSLAEQRQIGNYFQSIDNLITLHQCKCQIDGCRFQSPLAITWEQRKVTEIGKIYIGLVTTMTKHYTDEGTLLIRNSDIKDGKFEFGDNPIYLEKTFAEKNETRMHQIGDVITVHTGDVGTSAVITENEAKSIGFATIVTRPNPKIIDSNYLCSFLNTDKHKKWAVSISTGDGRTNYNLGDYFELVVPVPSIAEQKKIASYIQKLNRLITLHQCE